MKSLHVTGWVIKFVEKLKSLKNPNYTYKPFITTSSINEAKVLWIRDVQKDILLSFNYQNLLNQLGLYYDDMKLLRFGGRLKNADIPYESKHLVILPKNHRFTDLVIVFYHCLVRHNGTGDTLNMLRSEYWIPQGKSYVNEMLRQCIVCKKHGGKAYYYPEECPLPKEHVTSDFAFSYIGIDYAGPLFVKSVYYKEHDVMYKAWVVPVTCANSRGIYSDLVPDCTSNCCVDALKRFVNFHGAPKILISDNGKYFISTVFKILQLYLVFVGNSI